MMQLLYAPNNKKIEPIMIEGEEEEVAFIWLTKTTG